MDKEDTPKPRRPLPSPNVSSSALPASVEPVSTNNFYGRQLPAQPPPLPSRSKSPKAIGSNHTSYYAPSALGTSSYLSHETTPFREPELITEELITNDSHPDLVDHWPGDRHQVPATNWNGARPTWDDPQARDWHNDSSSTWHTGNGGFDTSAYTSSFAGNVTAISGRDIEEENLWWDASVRKKYARPGPGILPPLLTEGIHNSEHTLLSVFVSQPDIPRETATSSSSRESNANDNIPSRTGSPLPTRPPSPPPPPPTNDELHTAIPHPNAYYCRKHNGWVLIVWKSSSVVPPLARSFQSINHLPLPDQSRRREINSCIDGGGPSFRQGNKTHHFHLYEKAVDAHNLTPPFRRSTWEKDGKMKEKRRQGTLSIEEFDMEKLRTSADDMLEEDQEQEGDLLDLYICCQCSFYCLASGVIPGAIPPKFMEEFTKDKYEHPPLGKSGELSVLTAWETVLHIIENRLWRGENRTLSVSGAAFQRKVGWSPVVEQIFNRLGFTSMPKDPANRDSSVLLPVTTDVSLSKGRQNRAKLLRAWVEISVWLLEYRKKNAKALAGATQHKLWVKVDSAREMYQTAIGSHPDQLPRNLLITPLQEHPPFRDACQILGLTPSSYTHDLVEFAYLAQCRCDPHGTMEYFTSFYNIVKTMHDFGEAPQELQDLIIAERSRNRYTNEDLQSAAKAFGFGADGPLGIEFEPDLDEDFIANAWRDTVKRAWKDSEHGSRLLLEAKEAFRVLADARGSVKLRQMWSDAQVNTLTPDRAYEMLEVPREVDEAMLLTVFSFRLQERPSETDKWREALVTIAEVRDSDRLRLFLETGEDPGEATLTTRPDLPRGLNQLGNTCYLNSLLQYFYTIKELREAVAPLANADLKAVDDDKLTDDDIKRHRVGGRLVTRREILRSKKFVSQLADLFWNLEYCETAAVTPTIELAKLALVTSKDEEEEEADRGGTDSSNDTDATLVDDGPPRFPASPVARSPSSVLGKRPRRQQSQMQIDSAALESSKDKDGFVMVSKPASPRRSDSPPPLEDSTSQSLIAHEVAASSQDEDGDIEMRSGSQTENRKPPPLPPRKHTVSDSVMMFGKQHDVSECMDNCMFQIETALLKFDEVRGSQDDKASVVKKLFYGKMRQRVAVNPDERRSRLSVHEKEDLFSHLPVNVAEDGVDIYDGLSRYFDDVVEFEGKRAMMEVALVDLPPVLQIQLQRVQFNRETLQPYKSQAYIKFGETIFMDRFLITADPQKKAKSKVIQAQLNDCRDRLQVLTREKHAPFTAALSNTQNFLFKQDAIDLPDVDEDLLFRLNGEQAHVSAEIDSLRGQASKLKVELELLWRDHMDAAYDLTSVFVHRGSSPSWGHYFFYSRHLPGRPDCWFKYNDSDVTEVSKDEVLADTSGSTANPYLLVFARRGYEVVDTVKRFDPTNLDVQT